MKLLLLIDDGDADRALFQLAAEQVDGIDTVVIDNGADGLDAIRADKPDLVLLDLNMQGMSGYDVLAALPERMPPVVVYSSSNAESDLRKSLAMGARSYVTKPQGLAGIVAVLEAARDWWGRAK